MERKLAIRPIRKGFGKRSESVRGYGVILQTKRAVRASCIRKVFQVDARLCGKHSPKHTSLFFRNILNQNKYRNVRKPKRFNATASLVTIVTCSRTSFVLNNGTCWNIKGYCGQLGFQEDIAYTFFFETGYPVYQLTLHLYKYMYTVYVYIS